MVDTNEQIHSGVDATSHGYREMNLNAVVATATTVGFVSDHFRIALQRFLYTKRNVAENISLREQLENLPGNEQVLAQLDTYLAAMDASTVI